jgi:ABC-2 type transport system permease protein
VGVLGKRLVRAGAFVGKEINEVRRQPRLVLSLILGPFLILLLFGIGYRGETGSLSGIFVLPPEGAYSQDPEDYQRLVGDRLKIEYVTTDLNAALADLKRNRVDLVVAVPTNISQQISSGAQVIIPIFFNEVDPLRRDWIIYLSYVYTNEINKQTLAEAARQGQESAGDIRATIVRMRNSLAAVEQRLAAGDISGAQGAAAGIQGPASNVQLLLLLMSQFMSSDSTLVKPAEPQDPGQTNIGASEDLAQRLFTDIQALNDELDSPNPDPQRVRERLSLVRQDLDELERVTQQFQTINPLVLAAPFTSEAKNTAPLTPSFTAYYAPGMLVLILQHMAVTLASLSMVRERMLGTVELFRVSPVKPSEILLGKHVSFLLLLAIVAALLLLMMSNELTIGDVRLSLGVPILGDWLYLVLTLVVMIFASVGLGFFISTISKSESQAVQLSMLILLASVFFSGFFLRVDTIWEPVRAVSYSLPVTYGVSSLQVIMLRGGEPDAIFLLSLAGLGLLFTLLSFIMLNRELKRG